MTTHRADNGRRHRPSVLIAGSGRSGTTFLAKLLDSHPDVLYRHEPDSVLVDKSIPFLPRREEVPAFADPARIYLEALLHVRASKSVGQRPIFEKSYRSSLQKKLFLASLYLVKAVEKACGSGLSGPLNVPDFIDEKRAESIVPLIKTVDSPWRTLLFSEAMPQLRVLHIMRHPCAVINSCLRGIEKNLMSAAVYLRQPFETGMVENYPFTLEELEASSYEEKAAFSWMVCNQRIYDDLHGRESYRAVIYEDLCLALEPSTRGILRFAGLSWNEQTQHFISELEASEEDQAGYFNVVRSPASALDKWRDQLSTEQVGRIERVISHSKIGRNFLEGTWKQQGSVQQSHA